MENTNTTNNTTANETTTAQATRQREHGNFRGQRVMRDLSELDPKQFPQRPREDRVPMWAQQLQKSIDLLSQEQAKLQMAISHTETAITENKKLSEGQFLTIRENQKHLYEVFVNKNSQLSDGIGACLDICITLQKIHEEIQPKAKRTLLWKIFHPITAIKEWWSAHAEERRQRKAEKLKAQLKALQAQE